MSGLILLVSLSRIRYALKKNLEAAVPVRYLIALTGAAVLMAFVMGYEKGADSVRQGAAAESVRLAEQARQKEKDMQKKLNGITENYLHEIDEYKKTINAYAANDFSISRLSDTRPCQSVPGDTADRPGAVCYTPADIQRKIKESLDIAAECDELAIKYNALLKSVSAVREEKDEQRE